MADAGSLLGQLLGAALSNGGVRGGQGGNNAANGLPGALGDVLGQVLGGGASRTIGSSGGAGGLGDLLGQVLGGGSGRGQSGSGPSGGVNGGIGDILGQVLGGGTSQSGPSGGLGGSLGDILGQVLGGGAAQGGGQGGAPRGGSLGGSLGDLAGAALGGGSSGSVPSSSPSHVPAPAPSNAPSGGTQPAGGNDLVKYGGLAVIGMLAFNAFRKWQSQGTQGRSNFVSDPAAGQDGFALANVPGGPEVFSNVLLAAMVAAAQADGQIDQDEFNRIVGGLEKIGASGADQQALIEYLSVPVDPQILVSAAVTPQAASAIYVASLMAIQPDHPDEQKYLTDLASRLGIDPALKAQLDSDLAAA